MTDDALHSSEQLSRLLDEARAGRPEALEQLLPFVYEELRRLAGAYMRRERPGQTIQATALVHEAYVRLMGEENTRWQNRAHFMAIAAGSMRQILVERARARNAAKRAGRWKRITLTDAVDTERSPAVDVEALDQALSRLAALDSEQARLVELRFFGGLTIEETAEALGVSPATVKRSWSTARAWLRRELGTSGPGVGR